VSVLRFLCICILIAAAAPTLAQTDKTITADFEETAVGDALGRLASHFDAQIVAESLEGKANATITDGSLPQALTAVLTPLGYRWLKVVLPVAKDEAITAQDLRELTGKIESIGYPGVTVEDPRESKVTRLLTETPGTTTLEGKKTPDGKTYTAVYYAYDPARKVAPKMKEAAAPKTPQTEPGQSGQPQADLGTWLYGADPGQKAAAFLDVLRATILSDMPMRDLEQMMMNVGQQMTPLELEQIADFMRESLSRIDEATGG
jgi:hypothetical protein